MNKPVIFIIAGEASGDLLGGRLMRALKSMTGGAVEIHGIGGALMQDEGLKSLFPMEDLSVMGLAEVVPQIPKILHRKRETVEEVIRLQPDAVITIDAPDFCFRVVNDLKKRGFQKPCIHYVAPSVWAWRPGRAKKIARTVDHLLCFLPFEPPYFERHGLPTTYVGHSVVEGSVLDGNGQRFREKHGISSSETILTLLPGSRKGELDRHVALFAETAKAVQKYCPSCVIVLPTLPHFTTRLKDAMRAHNLKSVVIDTETDKYDAFAASDAALAASGTVTLELAVADVPTVVAYRMSPVTSFIAKLLVKGNYASLANIIMDQPIVPEYLLDQARVEALSDAVLRLLTESGAAEKQKQAFAVLRDKLNYGADVTPSEIAAQTILKLCP
ncbi:MAG: lipid-A-disaccharide synthase [Pseudomonadota bacterium]